MRLSSRTGNNGKAGTIQIYQNGTWGSICDETTFNLQAANVICRQLNFPFASAYYESSYFGRVAGKIFYGLLVFVIVIVAAIVLYYYDY